MIPLWGQIGANKDLPGRGGNDRAFFSICSTSSFQHNLGFFKPHCSPCFAAVENIPRTGKYPSSSHLRLRLGNAAQEERALAVKGIFREGVEHHLVKAAEGTISQPGDQLPPGITESRNCLSGKRPVGTPSPTMNPALPSPSLNRVPKGHISAFLEHFQG